MTSHSFVGTISKPSWNTTSICSPLPTNSQAKAMRWTDCPSRNITWEGKRGSTIKNEFKLGGDITYSNTPNIFANIACVASVSAGFPPKFRCFGRAKIRARAKKKEGGGGEEKRKRLQSNPWNLKTPFASERGS